MGLPGAVEHVGDDPSELLLHGVGRCALGLEHRAQFGGEGESPGLIVLRGAGLEPHRAGREVDLSPLELQHLTRHTPAGEIGERDDGLQRGREALSHRRELLGLKESGADVPSGYVAAPVPCRPASRG